MRDMKARPVARTMHGVHGEEEALAKFLDRELVRGVVNPSDRLLNPYHAKIANISDVDLDSLDADLAQP